MNPHPHELAPLLLALGRAGIELAPHPTDAGRLRHRPADLPPDLSARLRLHRAAVLELLKNPPADLPTPTGSPAWSIACGKALGVTVTPTPAGNHAKGGCGDATPPPADLERRAAVLAEDYYRNPRAEAIWGRYRWWQMGPTEQARWRALVAKETEAGCPAATQRVDLWHESIGKGDPGGGEGERSDPWRDRQGRGGGP